MSWRPAAIALVIAACKSKEPSPGALAGAGSAPALPPAIDWASCDAALRAAPRLPDNARAQALIDACHPCGDWKPLLDWNQLQQDGGPSRKAIEDAMAACRGFCDAKAKSRFLGALDKTRGFPGRGPWRELGEACGEEVSSVPDARYMSAPYFALDRIARAVAAHPSSAALLAAIDLPLPAVSISGAGLELPSVPDPGSAAGSAPIPDEPRAQLTVTTSELRVGVLPRATLSADGVIVGAGDYPGALVHLDELEPALAKLGDPIAVFAPRGMPATFFGRAVAASGHHTIYMAVANGEAPIGWRLHRTIPIALSPTGEDPAGLQVDLPDQDVAGEALALVARAPAGSFGHSPTISLGRDTTVATLAQVLGALAAKGVTRAVMKAGRPAPPRP